MNNNWEQISSVDALFGIASADDKKHKGWNESEFFKVGEQVVEKFMGNIQKFGYPASRDTALDFGCGAGRLLRFSSKYFKKVIGVDISQGMIDLSKKYNKEIPNITYQHNERPDLSFIEDASVDLVYTF